MVTGASLKSLGSSENLFKLEGFLDPEPQEASITAKSKTDLEESVKEIGVQEVPM